MSTFEEVTKCIREVLPSASPRPRDQHEALALCLHCVTLAARYQHEDASGNPCEACTVAEDWNSESEVSVFRYSGKKGKTMVVKVLKMGRSALAHIQSGSNENNVVTVEFNIDDYVNSDVPFSDYNKLYTLGLAELISRFQKAADMSHTGDATARYNDRRHADEPRRHPGPYPHVPAANDPLRDPNFRPGYPIRGGIGRGDLDPLGGAGGIFVGDPSRGDVYISLAQPRLLPHPHNRHLVSARVLHLVIVTEPWLMTVAHGRRTAGGHAGMLLDPRGLMGMSVHRQPKTTHICTFDCRWVENGGIYR
eukprot:m.545955 g.545955  ORF g.545955 m.545955 type:complete len:307 (+) comp22149_c0_seq1:433-1353(+)